MDSEHIETLITEVFARPAVWKFTHPQNKNKYVSKRSWEEIKQLLPGFEVDDLKKKWKNLKDTYRKELKKYDCLSNYESSWKYFNLLGFLKDDFMPKFKEEPNVDGDEIDHESVMMSENEEKYVDVSEASPPSPPSPPHSPQIQSPTPTSCTQDQTKKRPLIKDVRAEYLEIEKKKLKLLEKEVAKQNQIQATETKSDDYHFLMSILPEMERLPVIQKIRLRNKINEALMDEISASIYVEQPQHYDDNGFKNEPLDTDTHFVAVEKF